MTCPSIVRVIRRLPPAQPDLRANARLGAASCRQLVQTVMTLTVLVFLVCGASISSAFAAPASTPTDEIFRVVPNDMAACLVVEDLSGHYQRLIDSAIFARAIELPLVKQWRQSPEFRKLLAIQNFVPLYFGIDATELRDGILGQSVVLAFRPGKNPGNDDVGILFCRAESAEILDRFVAALTGGFANRQVEKREYRGIAYYERIEGEGRRDYLVVLDLVAAISDKEAAIHRVVDASLNGDGLDEEPTFHEMRAALPKGCLLQLLLQPRRFDHHLASLPTSDSTEALFVETVVAFWKSMRWTAFVLQADDTIDVSWLLSIDPEQLTPAARRWMELPAGTADFWKKTPADALAAATLQWDVASLAAFLGKTVSAKEKPELDMAVDAFGQLVAGYDLGKDVLGGLGPQVGVILTAGPRGPVFLSILQFKDIAGEAGRLPLSVSLESALRAVLVVIGMEANKNHQDTWAARLDIVNAIRIHSLSGARKAPPWLQPSFAIHGGLLLASTDPAAIARWFETPANQSLAETPFAVSLRERFPQGYTPIAYANISAIRGFLEQHRAAAIERLSKGHEDRRQPIGERLDLLLSTAGLLDRIVVGSRREDQVRHYTVSLYPTTSSVNQSSSPP